jgi:hypothetical protein
VPPIEASTTICHPGQSNCMSKVISAVHPLLLFTAPFFSVPTFLPAKTLTVGRLFMGSTGQRGNELPLALPRRCPLAYTVDGEQHIFTRLSLQEGPSSFWPTMSAGWTFAASVDTGWRWSRPRYPPQPPPQSPPVSLSPNPLPISSPKP